MVSLASKLDALAKRLRGFCGSGLALASELEDAAKALRGETP